MRRDQEARNVARRLQRVGRHHHVVRCSSLMNEEGGAQKSRGCRSTERKTREKRASVVTAAFKSSGQSPINAGRYLRDIDVEAQTTSETPRAKKTLTTTLKEALALP
jgi:hypothetical protein